MEKEITKCSLFLRTSGFRFKSRFLVSLNQIGHKQITGDAGPMHLLFERIQKIKVI